MVGAPVGDAIRYSVGDCVGAYVGDLVSTGRAVSFTTTSPDAEIDLSARTGELSPASVVPDTDRVVLPPSSATAAVWMIS